MKRLFQLTSTKPPDASRWRRLTLAALATLLAGVVHAASTKTCSVSTSGGLNLGAYHPETGSNLDTGATTLTVTCTCTGSTNSVSYNLAISAGNSGNYAARSMVKSGASTTLGYNLYSDAGRTVVWNNTTGVSGTISSCTTNSTASHTVYGRIPVNPNAVPGSYSEPTSLSVTLTY
ncbi:MAG: hypothetical protein RJA36_1346 [Pseudomonadota bacterium]|jgi:spore coat protein U-like protein